MPSWKKVITSGSDACLNSISVDSTTVVTNLNADKVDGCDASAFYLASNPSGFTTCTGTVTGTGVANNVAYWTSTGEIAADEGCLYWDPSSNELGIGTSTPGAPLHIYRNDTSVSPSLRIEQDGSGDALMQFVMTGANLWNVGIDNSNGDALTFARGAFSTGLETLVLKSTNVGIGNTNPPEALTVEGNISSSGDLTIDGDSTIDGNLTVGGTITAQEFKTELVSASIIYQSGSTKFGDTSDDVHSFSGSLRVTGSGDHYIIGGDVGIGTTAPSSKLEVVAASSTASSLGVTIRNTNSTNDPQFELGVGYPGYYDDSAVIRHNNVTAAYITCTGDLSLLTTVGIASNKAIQSLANGNAQINLYDGSGNTSIGSLNNLVFNNVGSEIARFTSTGNLGIGTTSPSQPLTVEGNISGSGLIYAPNIGTGEDNSVVVLDSDGTLRTDEIDSRVWGSTLVDSTGTPTAGHIPYFTDSNTITMDSGQLYWDASNNRLGIGTNAPTVTLDVRGNSTLGTGTNNLHKFNGHIIANTGSLTGTVTSPKQVFNFDGGGGDSYGIFSRNASNAGWLGFFGGSSGAVMYYPSTGQLQLGTSTQIGGNSFSEKARFDSSGNFGIGCNSPSTKLDVAGTVNASGNVTFGSNLTVDTNTLHVDSSGNYVGIGTNSPTEKLTVNGRLLLTGSTPVLRFSHPETQIYGTTNAGAGVNMFYVAANAHFFQGGANFNYDQANADFRVESQGNTAMLYVDASTNRVGIGTSTTSETLTVKGNTEVSGSIISPNFSAGLLGGDGYRLALSDTVGCTALEVDNLRVRGRLTVVEFLAQQIRATNGTLFVTSTGKVETVTTSGIGPYTACITTPTGSNHGFAVNDTIRAQRFDGFGNVYQSDLTVTAVPNPFAFTASYDIPDNEPQPGFEYVRIGNSSDTDRQGGIILSSDLDDSPYIKIYDEVDNHNGIFTNSKTKVLVGNLSSHNSTTFGCLSGSGGSPNYGFYASGSAYLEGSINATGGEIGGITICNTSISASNGGFEIKSDGSATFASGQITFESDGDITSNEYLVERSRVFGDGSDGCYTVDTTFSSVAGLFNVSSGTGHTVCLLRDAYFCNLTIDGTSGCWVCVVTNGYRMFVKDTLTVETYGFVRNEGVDGNNGNNAFGCIPGSGGSGGSGTNTGTLLGGTNGGAGGQGGGEEP